MNNTLDILKSNDQDFEWYPTTDEMISVVKAEIPMNAESIMDIGAGDGRALMAFSKKCEDAILYGIEKSLILVQNQDKKIIPVGTEFYEQNLAALAAQYIFCNPPYSDYEEWTRKIISEGYAREAFLVIPERWADSKLIAEAIKKRDAKIEVIYVGDFLTADRASRANIEIIKVRYKSSSNGYHRDWKSRVADPFDQWFEQNIDTFEKYEEERDPAAPKSQKERLEIKLRGSDIEEMVASYQEDYAKLEKNYRAIFELDAKILLELGVDKDAIREGLKKKLRGLKIVYWGLLFDRLDAITSRLTTKSRRLLLDKLIENNTIDFTVKNALAIGLWAINNVNHYIDDQLVDLFKELATFEGATNYVSNQKTWVKHYWRYNSDEHSHFKLDYRIVTSKYKAMYDGGYSHYEYPGELHNNCHDLIADMKAVFTNLGFKVFGLHSKSREWERGKWQNFNDLEGETVFQVKGWKNGNLHMRVMPQAMQALNIKAAQLLKWVGSIEEVVDELGYDEEIAEQYFNLNQYITINNLPLLSGGEPAAPPAPQIAETRSAQQSAEQPPTEHTEEQQSAEHIEEQQSAEQPHAKPKAKRRAPAHRYISALPQPIALKMVHLAKISSGDDVLDPAARGGALIDEILALKLLVHIKYCENDKTAQGLLKEKFGERKFVKFWQANFAETFMGAFDRIVMQPPFSSQHEIEYIQHAYGLLKKGGRLVSIVSNGTIGNDYVSTPFDEWLDSVGGWVEEKLPADTFKEGDKNIAANIIVINR